MDKKMRVGIVFGGKSAEHEVSLQSAKNIMRAIDKMKYDVVVLSIDKKGSWHLHQNPDVLLCEDNLKEIQIKPINEEVALIPGGQSIQLITTLNKKAINEVDVVFPVLHGPYGEDGTVQGLLKLANIPFVGASVLGSAIGMDKDVMKRLLRDAGLPIAQFLVFNKSSISEITFEEIEIKLGLPFFIKPANLGSSVGIRKVKKREEFESAVHNAFQYDTKILLEECVLGREIECSVLGNDNPIASLPGEIIPHDDFYSYKAKYIDEKGALLDIPAKLPDNIREQVREYAIQAFKVLCCEGMARVDFFLRENMEIIINEINTIPGFTKISMYPKLWEVSGIPYEELIDRLIQLAIERFKREQQLKTSVLNDKEW
jgi:D-alanine-D-alanine ligase